MFAFFVGSFALLFLTAASLGLVQLMGDGRVVREETHAARVVLAGREEIVALLSDAENIGEWSSLVGKVEGECPFAVFLFFLSFLFFSKVPLFPSAMCACFSLGFRTGEFPCKCYLCLRRRSAFR